LPLAGATVTDRTAKRLQQPQHGLEQRGLAAAVGAKEIDDLP